MPVHKLFSGSECLRGLDLEVGLQARHVNEKLRRVHRELQRQGEDTGWSEPEIDALPFVFTEGIAELDPELGPGVLAPLPHPLVAEALLDGQPVDFVVPPDPEGGFAPSLTIASSGAARAGAPEYVHVRHAVRDDGSVEDLNDDPGRRRCASTPVATAHATTSTSAATAGSRPRALSSPCRCRATCPPTRFVAAPDFYPNCDQRELVEWWSGSACRRRCATASGRRRR